MTQTDDTSALQQDLRILACQIDIPATLTAADRDRHLAETAAKVRDQLAAHPVDLVVMPELSSIDYSRDSFEQLEALAEPLDGPSFQTWRALAICCGVHICYSFARREGDQTYISIALVSPEGELTGHYDKLHLCQYGASMEKEYFSAGDHLFAFKVRGFTLAPVICYDIRFPELSRQLVLAHGVDVILHCGAYYRDASFPTWHAFAITRAIENQCYVLSLNRAGAHYGNSVFCPPWMDDTTPAHVFDAHDETFEYLTVTRSHLIEARRTYTFLKDKFDSYDLPMS